MSVTGPPAPRSPMMAAWLDDERGQIPSDEANDRQTIDSNYELGKISMDELMELIYHEPLV